MRHRPENEMLNKTRAKKEATYAQGPGGPYAVGTMPGREWSRGYYCAVAVLLRESGTVTPDVRSLFDAGGGHEHADAEDMGLFREHGLVPHNADVTGLAPAQEVNHE